MPDDRLVKQVVFGIMDGSDRRGRLEEDGQMTQRNGASMTYTPLS